MTQGPCSGSHSYLRACAIAVPSAWNTLFSNSCMVYFFRSLRFVLNFHPFKESFFAFLIWKAASLVPSCLTLALFFFRVCIITCHGTMLCACTYLFRVSLSQPKVKVIQVLCFTPAPEHRLIYSAVTKCLLT